MSIKRAMLTSAAVLGLSLFMPAASPALSGNPLASGVLTAANPAGTFTLVRGGGGHGGHGGGHGGFGGHGFGGGHGFSAGGRGIAAGSLGGRGQALGILQDRSVAMSGLGGRPFAPPPGASNFALVRPHASALGARGLRPGRLGRGHFVRGRIRHRRFFADGVWWDDWPYYDDYGYGGSCYANCLAAGHGPRYCSIYASDFC